MGKRDLFCREVLDEIVDSASMERNKQRMIANAGLCALADAICLAHAAEHASNGNYASALTLAAMGALTFIIGYYEARCAHALHTTPIEELKPPVLEVISVRNPYHDFIDE